MQFDLLKAFGYIERVVKSEEKNRKRPISHHTCATCSELPSDISTMGLRFIGIEPTLQRIFFYFILLLSFKKLFKIVFISVLDIKSANLGCFVKGRGKDVKPVVASSRYN